jgi:hypothetical protein
MIVYNGDACGIAYSNAVGQYNDIRAASIAGYLCDARTMVHEFGHNIGLQHDRYEIGIAPHEYSVNYREGYGWVDMANKERSIMSYNDQCSDNGFTCTRLHRFSSPNINRKGLPFGEMGYSDSVQFMNKYYGYVANFRDANTSYKPNVDMNCMESSQDKDIHCYVATAAFGNYMQEDVQILRDFRDQFLQTNLLGQKFVETYYEYSPYLAHYIDNNLIAKTISQYLIKAISFIIKYKLEVILGLFSLLGFKFIGLKALWLILFFGIIKSANADVAVPSLFSNYVSINPASRLLVTTPMLAGLSYEMREKNGKANNMEFTTEATKADVLIGTYTPQFFFDINVYTNEVATETIKSNGLADAENELETSELKFQLGGQFSLLGQVGFKYHRIEVSDNEKQESRDQQIMGLGGISLWSGLRLGYGFDLVSESGKNIADAKWLDLYFAVAGGSFSGSAGSVYEYNFYRSPEVVASDGVFVNARPEVWSHTFIYEMAAPIFDLIPIDKFRFHLNLEQQKAMDVYYDDPVNKTEYGLRFGGSLFGSTNYNFDYSVASYDNQTNDSETRMTLGLYWGLGGAMSSGGGGGGEASAN